MPKGYIVARIAINDAAAYDSYREDATSAIRQYGGKPMARGGRWETLEGEGRDRNVILEFESYDAARTYFYSPEYQRAKEKRRGAAIADIVLVEGI